VRGLGVVSDENLDAPSAELWEGGRPVVRLLEFAERRGKAAVLNDLMARAGQPVVVMMDARQRIPAGALSTLLEPFADPQVGVVSGALVYETAEGGAPKGADSYWSYEKQIRLSESRFWAVPGATGALYAIRRELLAPIPAETLVDDVLIPMQAVLRGYRCLFEPKAQVFDRPTSHFGQENLRKRRTLAGIWQTMRLMPKIYSPAANPIWWQWVSHKFLRLLTPFLVILALFSLVGLAEEGFLWAKWLLGGALGAMLASAGAYWGAKWFNSRILGLMGAFFGVNLALLQAAGDALTGRFEARWSK
jgi:cellulose synthase/poly-beta-1,6-N-acetylglucosamine synthase-like glycosyltransferase